MAKFVDTVEVDRGAHERWKVDPTLRAQFGGNFEWYRSYARAEAAGTVRVHGGGRIVTSEAAPAPAPAAAPTPTGGAADARTMTLLRAAYPAHVAALKSEGAADERARIEAAVAAAFGNTPKWAGFAKAVANGTPTDIKNAAVAAQR